MALMVHVRVRVTCPLHGASSSSSNEMTTWGSASRSSVTSTRGNPPSSAGKVPAHTASNAAVVSAGHTTCTSGATPSARAMVCVQFRIVTPVAPRANPEKVRSSVTGDVPVYTSVQVHSTGRGSSRHPNPPEPTGQQVRTA